jgi:fatty acid-binding protein DegV
LLPKFARYVAKRSDRKEKLRMAIGHALCAEEARKLEQLLRERLPGVSESAITDLGPALGVHGGPGTLVVAVQHKMDPLDFRKSSRQQDQ